MIKTNTSYLENIAIYAITWSWKSEVTHGLCLNEPYSMDDRSKAENCGGKFFFFQGIHRRVLQDQTCCSDNMLEAFVDDNYFSGTVVQSIVTSTRNIIFPRPQVKILIFFSFNQWVSNSQKINIDVWGLQRSVISNANNKIKPLKL